MFILVFSSGIHAFADSYSSWKTTGKINGHYYKYRSGVLTYSSYIQARAHTKEKDGNRVGSGYMGGRTYIYNSSGSLKSSSDWDYNSSPCTGIDFAGAEWHSPGTYYTVAKFHYYNGNGYSSTFTANRTVNVVVNNSKSSPSLSLGNSKDLIDAGNVSTTPDGRTYGSGLLGIFDGEMPYMVSAIGNNNIEGYVLSSDLEGNTATTLADAKSMCLKPGERVTRVIPLYSLSGEVIGSFSMITVGGEEY